jgi:beta-mannosidase
MIARLAQVVAEHDPKHRFLPTSPSGPRFGADEERFGQGQHWDVHGPWHVSGSVESDWRRYWEHNDALFHSEVGVAGASSVEIIRQYRGDLPEMPATTANPLWRRTSWWIDWPAFLREMEREPESLDEFVAWSQERQRRALQIAVSATKSRFPRCGGFLLWMGHDSFPCTANTSIIDFHGTLKPAAKAVGESFRRPAGGGVAASEEHDHG